EQRRKIDTVGERVDRRGFLLVAYLDQAQQRPVGVLAHELGIDRDEFRLREPFTEFGQLGGRRDQRVYFHRYFSIGRIGSPTWAACQESLACLLAPAP